MCRLQELHLHNNHLTALPDELASLRRLFVLVLAFNRFLHLPPVLTRMTKPNVSEVENVILSGNQVDAVDTDDNVLNFFTRKQTDRVINTHHC